MRREIPGVTLSALGGVHRQAHEYGPEPFWLDYGPRLKAWIARHDAFEEELGEDRIFSRVGSWVRLGFRTPASGATEAPQNGGAGS